MRVKVYERPTPRLRWLNGVLQQNWRIQWRDEDTLGAANPETFEWRDVPAEIEQRDAGSEVNDMYGRGEHMLGVTR